MELKGIFFDLFGTLLVYGDMAAAWSDWLAVLHVRLCRFGLNIEPHRLAAECDGFFSRPEPPFHLDGMTVYEKRLGALCSGLGLDPTVDQIRLTATDSVAAWQRYLDLAPDAASVLAAVKKKVAVALVTNFDHPPHVHKVLQDTGLSGYFDFVVISGDVGVKKPDPRIFAIALDHFGLSAESVAYVGDAPEDVDGATAAQLLPIYVRRESDNQPVPATDFHYEHKASVRGRSHGVQTIRNLSELLDLLNTI